MNDNDLITLILAVISEGILMNGYEGVVTQSSYQPTQQGIPSSPTIYLHKIGDIRYGFLKRQDVWAEDSSTMIHTETQIYESTFQITTLVLQDPVLPSYTGSDLANSASFAIQSDYARQMLAALNVYVLRVHDVRNPWIIEDRDNFEAAASFDFILTYNRDNITQSNIITPPIIRSITRI